jgi:hypothetical protein
MQNDVARIEDVIVSLLLYNNFDQTSKWTVLSRCSSRRCSARSAPCDTPSWSRIKVSGVRNSLVVFLEVILKILLIKFESTPCRIRDDLRLWVRDIVSFHFLAFVSIFCTIHRQCSMKLNVNHKFV